VAGQTQTATDDGECRSGKRRWLSRNVLTFGLTSPPNDLCHEIATAVLPQFMHAMGASPAALGGDRGDGRRSLQLCQARRPPLRRPPRPPQGLVRRRLRPEGTCGRRVHARLRLAAAARRPGDWLAGPGHPRPAARRDAGRVRSSGGPRQGVRLPPKRRHGRSGHRDGGGVRPAELRSRTPAHRRRVDRMDTRPATRAGLDVPRRPPVDAGSRPPVGGRHGLDGAQKAAGGEPPAAPVGARCRQPIARSCCQWACSAWRILRRLGDPAGDDWPQARAEWPPGRADSHAAVHAPEHRVCRGLLPHRRREQSLSADPHLATGYGVAVATSLGFAFALPRPWSFVVFPRWQASPSPGRTRWKAWPFATTCGPRSPAQPTGCWAW